MGRRSNYALLGLLVGAVVNLVISLLSAAIQKQAFSDQFSKNSILFLIAMALAGLLVGYWLSGEVQIPTTDTIRQGHPDSNRKTTTITRLQAIFSYVKIRGGDKGIRLKDIFTFGSKIDIDT